MTAFFSVYGMDAEGWIRQEKTLCFLQTVRGTFSSFSEHGLKAGKGSAEARRTAGIFFTP